MKECECKVSIPSLFVTILEVRLVLEAISYILTQPMINKLPKGNGEPVLINPGFLFTDSMMAPVHAFVKRLNYEPYGWGLGWNLGYKKGLSAKLGQRLDYIYKKTGQPVRILGFSLGGVFTREQARRHPDKVDKVITMFSPFRNPTESTFLWMPFKFFSNRCLKDDDAMILYNFQRLINFVFRTQPHVLELKLLEEMSSPPPGVPTTSIYSKSDGLVAWQCCLEDETDLSENIRVRASHIGGIMNIFTLLALADRLAQPAESWKKFVPKDYSKMFYPFPQAQLVLE